MRVVILTVGSRGDIQPYMALGLGFQAEGHDVCLATDATFETEIRALRLDFHLVEGDPRGILEGEEGLAWLESGKNPLAFMQRFSGIMIPLLKKGLQDSWNACEGADVMVFSVLGWFAAQSIHDKSGIPFMPAYLLPADPTHAFPSPMFPIGTPLGGLFNRLTYTLIDHSTWKAFRKAMNSARRDILDLPPMPLWQPFAKMRRERHPLLYGYSPSFLPKPVEWGDWLYVTGYWFLQSLKEWEPPAELLDFLQSGHRHIQRRAADMGERIRAEDGVAVALEIFGHCFREG